MADFHIKPLPAAVAADLFGLTEAELAARQARLQIVTEKPGTPCRVSLEDAEVGETVVLVHHQHQPADSPYRASHAIFVRKDAKPAAVAVNAVPEVIRTRLISLRFFDQHHFMVAADVLPGAAVGAAIAQAFDDATVAYGHLHYAKPGCFAAAVHRVA